MCVCSCSEGSVHHTVAEVVRFVEGRIKEEEGKESHSLRGPYLARLELLHRLRERGCPEESLLGNTPLIKTSVRFGLRTDLKFPPHFVFHTGDPLELMVQFFGKFGEKPCCITDLILYLHLLAPEQHVQVKSEYVSFAN